jgi:hypothetical protein
MPLRNKLSEVKKSKRGAVKTASLFYSRRKDNTVIPMRKKSIHFSIMILLLLATSGLSFAQIQNEWETTTLKIALFGPGTPLYSWWGHIGIIIDDAANARIVDYGIFSFEKENFFTNFAFGRLIYSCGTSPALDVINDYTAQNRDVTLIP